MANLAAQDFQAAIEKPDKNNPHGLFTWALLKVLLSTPADEPVDWIEDPTTGNPTHILSYMQPDWVLSIRKNKDYQVVKLGKNPQHDLILKEILSVVSVRSLREVSCIAFFFSMFSVSAPTNLHPTQYLFG